MGRPLQAEIDHGELVRRLEPRDDVLVREHRDRAPDAPLRDGGEARFGCEHGPFAVYQRVVTWEPLGPDRYRYDQYVRFWPAIPLLAPMFFPLFRRALRHGVPRHRSPIWVTPDRLSAREARLLTAMCLFHIAGGVMFSFLSNVLTFISTDLGDGSAGEQSVVLAVARLGVLGTIAVMAFADHIGRRRVALWSASVAVVFTIACAFVPGLVSLTALQTVARSLAIASILASDTLTVEQLPAGSRAAAQGLGALSYGMGAGMVVLALPLADLSAHGWRFMFAVALVCVPLLIVAARHLPESERFITRERFSGAARRVDPKRFVYLGVLFLLLSVFVAPSSQLQNDYLRADRGFSGSTLTLFIVVTSIPGLFGILLGSRLADRRSRRLAIVPGMLAIGVFGALFYSTGGAPMWVATLLAAGLGTIAIPALGVLAPELFPTARRGTTRGALSAVATAGSVIGLLTAGVLVDHLGYGTAFTWLAIAPIAGALLALWAPETSGAELESLNEERDQAVRDQAVRDQAVRDQAPRDDGAGPTSRGALG